MKIIPVLDLAKGLVVHAVKGDRKNYKPIVSKLCNSSDPIHVTECLLSHYDFKSIYIADLDALVSQGENIKTIDSIINTCPYLEIWLDTGEKLINYYLERYITNQLRVILSSESIVSLTNYFNYINNNQKHNFILSIDYISGEIIGPRDLTQTPSCWPKDVLFINLDRVGSNGGIQIPDIINTMHIFKNFNFYYGGGIKDFSDFEKLKSIGATGGLISTALHEKNIAPKDIEKLMN